MKRKWVVASSLGLLGLASVPLACFSSTTSSPEEGNDASTTSPEDSGILEEASTPAPDSGVSVPADAGVDAPTVVVDAGPQPLTVTVLLLGAPESGINVVFQDDTGAPLATAITDATGTVSEFVTAGSQVTVLLGTPQNPNLVTIEDVAPGDALKVLDTAASTSTYEGENLAVSLPAPTWDASGIAEEVYAGSCYNSLPNSLYLAPYCISGGQYPLLARAANEEIGQELAYTYQLGNAEPDGGLPDGDTALPITVTRPWTTSTATATVTAANPPGLPDGDGGTTSTADGVSLYYYEVAEGLSFSGPQGPGGTSSDGGTQSAAFTIHPGYPDFVQGEALDTVRTDNGIVVTGAAARAASQATSLAMSFNLSTLPLITSSAIDSTDGGTTSQPNVTWTSTGSLSAANGIFISAQWYADSTTDAGYLYVNGTWTILAPPTATNVRAPALPAPLAAWAPSAAASFYSNPRVGAVQTSFVPGYPGLRSVFGSLSLISGYRIVPPVLPANGTLYVVGIYPDEG